MSRPRLAHMGFVHVSGGRDDNPGGLQEPVPSEGAQPQHAQQPSSQETNETGARCLLLEAARSPDSQSRRKDQGRLVQQCPNTRVATCVGWSLRHEDPSLVY